ncbi:ArdC-like ssDNA-binding domain-containing protein [Haloprofundus halophilus]|uniref:ArdC-like ssDNA-binding domain-containing protein n=1 Tax=Haloprofundus halophilus TaxID=2283527 RepID=UPI000E4362B1|nr:ArdC-like ssDNA-binding domain-containing protein [Haloprofundus halophilus]
MSTTEKRVTFDESETRNDQMQASIDEWIEDLTALVDEARTTAEFQTWLDVQSRFHDYSYRNTLLIRQQCPHATRVAGYRTWQTEFDRHVIEGEQAIWIWAPIITDKCPECGNSPSYHNNTDCEYDETPPEEWNRGVVGFRPVPVFDVSQTEGESLPELDTDARGDASDILPALLEVAPKYDADVSIVPPVKWEHGEADGICKYQESDLYQKIKVKQKPDDAAVAGTLIHEIAHAILHDTALDETERAKREVEAEGTAYIVGRYFDLDMSGSALYLAAWEGDDPEAIADRLQRISSTAEELIGRVWTAITE